MNRPDADIHSVTLRHQVGLRHLLSLILLVLVFSGSAYSLDVPPLRGHVNDYAGMLSPQTAARLESELAAFERTDSTQIVLLTIPSLAGEDLQAFSIRVAEAWKIGLKGRDNGVILLIAKAERRIRIEVGRGLEGKLTDLVSGRIIRGDIGPRFKAGDFDGGITAGLGAVMAVVKGEYTAAPRDLRHGKKSAPPVMTLLLFLAVACVFLGALSRVFGGIAGAVGLPVVGFLTFPGLGLLVLAGMAITGFLLGLFLTTLFGGGRGGGGFMGGGPWIGGGFGGGQGGGFGGFSGGGGDFGGGGASGDW